MKMMRDELKMGGRNFSIRWLVLKTCFDYEREVAE